MTEPDVAQIARSLSEAQRRWLTVEAVWRAPRAGHAMRWMTFPPKNTHAVLVAKGLVDWAGQIRPLGLAVRQYLEEQK